MNTTAMTANVRAQETPISLPVNGQPKPWSRLSSMRHSGYRAWGTPEGDFLARQMERLAQLIRWTGASMPEDHEDRMEVWDAEIRDRYWDMGFHEGLVAGRRECRCGTCFKDRD